MKTTYLTIALMMGMFAAPVFAADSTWDRAVELSAQDSGASMADLCNEVYKAAKQTPQEDVGKLFEAVLARRTNWNTDQCYSILRAILLAMPGNVACNIGEYTRKYEEGKGSAVEGQKIQRARYSATLSESAEETAFYNLLDALYNASLPEGVAEKTIASIMPTVNGVYETAVDAAINNNDSRLDTNGAIINGLIPTPPPTSAGT